MSKRWVNFRIEPAFVLMFLRSFALLLVIVISYLIFLDFEKNLSLIAALGILISALLASYSVILNIDTTVKLKNLETTNQIRYIFFILCRIRMRLIALRREKINEKVTFLDIDRIFNTISDISEMTSKIENKDIISILHNNVLGDLDLLLFELNYMNISIKTLRKNTIKPELSKDAKAVFSNPLTNEIFKFENSIERLAKILTYIKNGYPQYFPENGGIEMCANYEI